MIWHVIPQSLDAGELGIRIEADTAETAAALAVAGPYAAHAGEVMVVRWDVRYDQHGEVSFARCADVCVAGVSAAVEPEPAPPEPSPEFVAQNMADPVVVAVTEMPSA